VSLIAHVAGESGTLTVQSAPTFVAGFGNQFAVTYTFTPPGGQWTVADAGLWTVSVASSEVADYMSVPRYVPAGVIATFVVKSTM
jgi:hypothetical protein